MSWKMTLVVIAGAATVSATQARTAQAQQASRPSHAADTAGQSKFPASGSSISVAGHNKGYTGVGFGGTVGYGPDGRPRWADFPKIQRVDAGSPGERAGLLVGDAILSVNGVDGHQGKLLLATEAGQTFVIRVRRGEALHEYTIVSAAKPGAH